MRNLSQTICVSVGVAITCSAAYIAVAGNLVPPAGAPAPTMRTLDEIYGAIQGVSNNLNEFIPGLEMAGLFSNTSTDPGPILVVPGNGLLHAIVISTVTGIGWTDVSDGDGVIGQFAVAEGAESSTNKIILNARYSGGLRAQRRLGGGAITFLYLPDP